MYIHILYIYIYIRFLFCFRICTNLFQTMFIYTENDIVPHNNSQINNNTPKPPKYISGNRVCFSFQKPYISKILSFQKMRHPFETAFSAHVYEQARNVCLNSLHLFSNCFQALLFGSPHVSLILLYFQFLFILTGTVLFFTLYTFILSCLPCSMFILPEQQT